MRAQFSGRNLHREFVIISCSDECYPGPKMLLFSVARRALWHLGARGARERSRCPPTRPSHLQFLILCEKVLGFKNGEEVFHEPASGFRKVDFGGSIGEKTVRMPVWYLVPTNRLRFLLPRVLLSKCRLSFVEPAVAWARGWCVHPGQTPLTHTQQRDVLARTIYTVCNKV